MRRLREAGVPIAAATTGNETLDRAALTRLGVVEHFSAIFTCGQLNTSKREPIIYQRAAKLLGAAPEEIMVFEDALYAARAPPSRPVFWWRGYMTLHRTEMATPCENCATGTSHGWMTRNSGMK